jgi:predicted membrane protein
MFCPKCGHSEYGKFCRICGTNLALVSDAITEPSASQVGIPSGGGITLAFFGPAAVANDSRNISHHRAIAVFGEVTFDLTAAPLPAGETTISAYTLFGSINILVPDDVGLRVTGLTACSDIKVRGEAARNNFFDADEYRSPNYQEAARRLHIEVASLFAGIKIRR